MDTFIGGLVGGFFGSFFGFMLCTHALIRHLKSEIKQKEDQP